MQAEYRYMLDRELNDQGVGCIAWVMLNPSTADETLDDQTISPHTWAVMRRDEPELFDRAQQLEDTLNARRDELGRDHVYLTRFGRRLSDAIVEAQSSLFDDDGSIGEAGCDEGMCFV